MNDSAPVVLVVDDEFYNRELLSELLSDQGYKVVTAADGKQGLEELSRSRPSLVLTDVRMPVMNGFEFCQRIKNDPETRLTPVILVTGLSASEDRLRGIEAGADDFLNKPVDTIELLARARSLLRLKAHTDELEKAESVLFALARSIEAKDPYTENHCERLAEYSVSLAERIGLVADDVTALWRAGIVHDVGKVAVPDSILLKAGPLTPEEWVVMRKHPVVGENICAPLKSFRRVLPIIRHHHEKFDGSGYPDGLRGEQIPLTARVLQLVDIYDALTTDCPYRAALPVAQALEAMAGEVQKGWWDPQLFTIFREMISRGTPMPAASCFDIRKRLPEAVA